MKQFIFPQTLYLLAIFLCATSANAKISCQKYFSPNHKLQVIVENRFETDKSFAESVVSVYNSQGKQLLQKSYLSPDHEHGYNVVQLKWSADSKFCVWSLTSSGGHSPWHFPTDCYIEKCNAIINIDAQLNCGLTQAKFKLRTPHVLLSQRLIPNPKGEPKYAKVIFDLNNLKCH